MKRSLCTRFDENFKCSTCLKNYDLKNNIVTCNMKDISIDCCHKCINNIREKKLQQNTSSFISPSIFKAPSLLPVACPKDNNIPYLLLPPSIIELDLLYDINTYSLISEESCYI